MPARLLICTAVFLICNANAFGQHAIGGAVGWTRSDHWYRSTVGVGLLYTRAFVEERVHVRASSFCHIPVIGRQEGPYDGQPSPIAHYTGSRMNTYDRYWGYDADADVLLNIAHVKQRHVHAYLIGGMGYRNERFDYQSTIFDPAGGAIELNGRVLRDRFALRAGFGSSIGIGPGKLFAELVTDAWSYVADRSLYQRPRASQRVDGIEVARHASL